MEELKRKAMILYLLFARIKLVLRLVFQNADYFGFMYGYNYFYK